MRDRIDPGVTFKSVFQDPEFHIGKVVLWGGVIIQTLNEEGATWIELLQQPLRRNNRPILGNESEGRFLIRHEGFLDPVIYRSGREMTVVGEIQGAKTKSLGEIEYSYPVLSDKKLLLWDLRREPMLHFGFGLGATF